MKKNYGMICLSSTLIALVLAILFFTIIHYYFENKKDNAVITVNEKPIAKIIDLTIINGSFFSSDKTLLKLADSSFISLWGSQSFNGDGTYYIATSSYRVDGKLMRLCKSANVHDMDAFNKCTPILGGSNINSDNVQ